jgi:hypothetical protein
MGLMEDYNRTGRRKKEETQLNLPCYLIFLYFYTIVSPQGAKIIASILTTEVWTHSFHDKGFDLIGDLP